MSSTTDAYARAARWVSEQAAIPVATPVPVATPAASPVGDCLTLAAQVAAALCRRFEGLFLKPYLCPAGIPTIGYGATYYEDGRRVKLSDPAITREHAEALLLWMILTVYLPAVLTLCPSVTNANRLAALIDFAFNLGAGQLSASTLRKRANAGQWGDVPGELMKWVKGGGRTLAGLVRRRSAESALI